MKQITQFFLEGESPTLTIVQSSPSKAFLVVLATSFWYGDKLFFGNRCKNQSLFFEYLLNNEIVAAGTTIA